jgi:hypothetical protein
MEAGRRILLRTAVGVEVENVGHDKARTINKKNKTVKYSARMV